MSSLIWSDAIADDARETLIRVQNQLAELDVAGQLSLTGAASVPGTLTKGDIDLHLRVADRSFSSAIARLKEIYPATSLHAWAETLAVFEVPAAVSTGLAVTPAGSEHDVRFTLAWRLLRENPEFLQEYNEIKRSAYGHASYEDRKSAFFTRITQT